MLSFVEDIDICSDFLYFCPFFFHIQFFDNIVDRYLSIRRIRMRGGWNIRSFLV